MSLLSGEPRSACAEAMQCTEVLVLHLELVERYGVVQEDGVLIDLDLSQEAIASLVGTTRESANRALSGMREQGIVQYEDLIMPRNPVFIKNRVSGLMQDIA